MSSPYEQQPNPYGSPHTSSAPVRNLSMPGNLTAFFVIDLLICLLRGGQAAFGLFLLMAAAEQVPEASRMSVLADTLTAAGVAIFGIPGNALMLARQAWASALGYAAVFFTVCNMGAGLWNLMVVFEAAAQNAQPGFKEGMVIGFAISFLIRSAIVIAYLFAVFQFDTWVKQLEPQSE